MATDIRSYISVGFRIQSAVDLGNQSVAACEFFCIVCERLTIPIVQAYALPPAACCAGGDVFCRSLKLIIK